MSESDCLAGFQVPHNLFPRTAVVCLSPNHGGMEISSRTLASRLSKWSEGCIFIVRRNSWLEEIAREASLAHVPIAMKHHFSVNGIRQIRKALKDYDIRLVIYAGSSEMRTLRFCINQKIDRFVVRHGTPKTKSKTDLIHRFLWSKVTHHMAISNLMRSNVSELFPVKGRSVFVNYVSQGEKLESLPIPKAISAEENTLRIVQIARVERVKGQFDGLKVLQKIRDSAVNAKLTFYGSGQDLSELKEAARARGLSAHVSFEGQVREPYKYLGEHHVFLYPSYSEGFGNSFAEALSAGIHSLCYDNTCLPEYRHLGFCYEMVRTGDIDSLVARIREIWITRESQPLENREVARSVFSDAAEMTRLHNALY